MVPTQMHTLTLYLGANDNTDMQADGHWHSDLGTQLQVLK